MKNLIIATSFVLASVASTATGQVRSVAAARKPPSSQAAVNPNTPNGTRARVLGNDSKAAHTVDTGARSTPAQPELQTFHETARVRRTEVTGAKPAASNATASKESKTQPASTNSAATSSNLFTNYPSVSMASTQIYRVGANDVLDIQIAGNANRESTLFTVSNNGLVEYPLAGDPIAVAGLTTSEITMLLKQRIRIFDNPVINVSVRDYASHAVTVTGLVAAPGRKVLRRDAVPLYAMLAESLVLPEAGRATITRFGRAPIVADLKDSNHMATLVIAGDMIKVSGTPPSPAEYFFVGGAISSPGQKPFHSGLTLTQALLASGGTTVKSDLRIRISRLGQNGHLVAEEHNLKKIQSGKLPDPVLQKGDRIEVIPLN